MPAERLQKLLARAGIASRRASEELIAAGRVTVNSRVAGLGEAADPGIDRIEVDGVRLPPAEAALHYAVHKPAGMLSSAVMRDYARALMAGLPPGLLTSDGGITGNPADFIVDADGRIAFAHYGRHYADSLDAAGIARIRRGLETGRPAVEVMARALREAAQTR